MRAIDADFVQDALTKTITEILSKSQNESTQYVAMGLASIKTIIDIAPTLDVAPVRHGRWEQDYELVQGMEDNSEYPYVACNLCGHREYDVDLNDYTDYDDLPKYCPNCGAKMDAGQEETK